MPIPLTCDCGRTMRVKDELAGRKIRCPDCTATLAVPKPETPHDAEEEALNLLLEESDEPTTSSHNDAENLPATDAIQESRPGPRPPQSEPDRPEWKWKKKTSAAPKSLRKPRAKSGGGLFNNVNPNYGVMWTGILMILGSLALGLVNVAIFFAGWVIFRLAAVTVILFFVGLGTFFKGLMGRSD
jgi:hypothetical protein